MTKATQKYRKVIRFTGGTLEGLTYEQVTTYYVAPGTKVLHPGGGTSPYVVVSCDPI